MGQRLASWCIVSLCALSIACSRRDHVPTAASESADGAVDPPRAPPSLPDGYYYTFTPSEDFAAMTVDVCFVGVVPQRLDAPLRAARDYLSSARHGSRALDTNADGVVVSGVAPGDCIRYAIDTAAIFAKATEWDGVGRMADDALLSPDYWLWPPEPRKQGSRVFARFAAGDAWRAAVPWPRDEASGYSHVVPESAFVWKSQAAFGRFAEERVEVGKSVLDVVPLADGFGDQPAVMAWLTTSANAVSTLLDGFPVDRVLVLLVGDDKRESSFGYMVRGGGSTATLLLPANAKLDGDWTGVHELLHLSLPPLPNEDAWLYEGVVTYLTAVARARAGIISESYAWWELLDGFRRGRTVGTGVPLREEAKLMHENRAYWRVYWAGAAMSLSIDMDLRRAGGALDKTLAALAKSYPDEAHSWTGSEVMARFDALAGSDVPSKTMAAYVDETTFPDTDALAKKLGVKIAPYGKTVIYDDTAPDAAIRRAIMLPPSSMLR